MDYRSSFVPIIGDAVEKSLKDLGKKDEEIKEVKDKIENTILTDDTLNFKIDSLMKEGLKTLDTDRLPGLRAAVRPAVTILLAVTFVFLIVIPFAKDLDPHFVNWDKVFSSFMGVFGTIIGFWFGERSALKIPGRAAPAPAATPNALLSSRPVPAPPPTPSVTPTPTPSAAPEPTTAPSPQPAPGPGGTDAQG